MSKAKAPSQRTKVKRGAAKAAYDEQQIAAILDEALMAYVGFADEHGTHVIPMAHWRMEDRLVIHGSTASRMMRQLASGVEACITVTILDGFVLARSAFHHSMNYRSVMVYGRGKVHENPEEKEAMLDAFMDRLFPKRKHEARKPYAKELKGTMVMSFPLDEAVAKIRRGGPVDEPEDMGLPVWSGVLPLRLTAYPEQQDPLQAKEIPVPDYVKSVRLMQFPAAWSAGEES